MTIWSGKRVSQYVRQPPLVKINPNGVDLGVSEIFRFDSISESILDGKTRETKPSKIKMEPIGNFYVLPNGVYEVRIANEVSVPKNAAGLLFPRSTLNRLGIIKSETAIWDSGYIGYGTQTILVSIKKFTIRKDEFWFQLMFKDAEQSDFTYDGHWQKESPTK